MDTKLKKDRITFLVGAGAPLDLCLPENMTKPSTKDITGKVLEPYKDCNDRDIDLVGHIYKKLEKWYNCPSYFPLYKPLRADVNFEHLFHVLEMLDSYRMAWKDKCHND